MYNDITDKIRDTAGRINGLERPKPNERYALQTVSHIKRISQNQKNATDNTEKASEEKNNEKMQFSVSDNKGRKLTKVQEEYFKDSKVRDENGNRLAMYHGTPNGD